MDNGDPRKNYILRGLLIWPLVVALSHAPLPWVHSHDGLSPEQLVVHLQQYHANCPASKLPCGWHLHCVDFGQADRGNDVATIQWPSTRWTEFRSVACLLTPETVDVARMHEIVARGGVSANGRMPIALPKQELFKQYGSFLI